MEVNQYFHSQKRDVSSYTIMLGFILSNFSTLGTLVFILNLIDFEVRSGHFLGGGRIPEH